MPTLKHLTCHVQWAETNTPFPEHGTAYGDGVVETYILVPNTPQAFTIRLTSKGYIAEGLAVVVFVDGTYHCNRNRVNLKPISKKIPRNRTEIDFLLRQKEKSMGEGVYLGREWRFDEHNIVSKLPTGVIESHFDLLGTIEVLVLRCRANTSEQPESPSSSSAADSEVFMTPNAEKDHREPKDGPDMTRDWPTSPKSDKRASKNDNIADDMEYLPFMGLFDGAADDKRHSTHHNPSHGHWEWKSGTDTISASKKTHRPAQPGRYQTADTKQAWSESDPSQQSATSSSDQDPRQEKRVHFDFGPASHHPTQSQQPTPMPHPPYQPYQHHVPAVPISHLPNYGLHSIPSYWTSATTPHPFAGAHLQSTRLDHQQPHHYPIYQALLGTHARHVPRPGVMPSFSDQSHLYPPYFAQGPGYLVNHFPPFFPHPPPSSAAVQPSANNIDQPFAGQPDEPSVQNVDEWADPYGNNNTNSQPNAEQTDNTVNMEFASDWQNGGTTPTQETTYEGNDTWNTGNNDQDTPNAWTNDKNEQNSWEDDVNEDENNPPHQDSEKGARPLFGPHGAYYQTRSLGPEETPPDAEEEPRYDVPKSIAASRRSSKQVHSGKGYLYCKNRSSPDYIDTMDEPYARFVFKYRTKEQLKNELGLDDEIEPTGNEDIAELENLDKSKLVELLIRAKSALGGIIPTLAPNDKSPNSPILPRGPVAITPPVHDFLKYEIPRSRANRGLGISNAKDDSNDTAGQTDWNTDGANESEQQKQSTPQSGGWSGDQQEDNGLEHGAALIKNTQEFLDNLGMGRSTNIPGAFDSDEVSGAGPRPPEPVGMASGNEW